MVKWGNHRFMLYFNNHYSLMKHFEILSYWYALLNNKVLMSFLNFRIQWIDLWQVVIKFLVEKKEPSKIFPTPTCGFVAQLLVVPANQSLIFFSSFFTSTATIAARLRGVFLWLIFISYTGQRKFISVQVARKFH